MILKNRFVMSPMGVCLANENGGVTPQLIEFYRERAKGGAALILVGGGGVKDELRTVGMLAMHTDHTIPGLNDLAEAVQEEGACIGIQLNFNDHHLPPEHKRKAPDNVTPDEIEDIINLFVKAAVRVKKAGFDVVEFHGGHGYMLSQFFSKRDNHRTDQYGGDVERRQTVARKIVRRTRTETGHDFPIFFRINGHDFLEGGTDIAEAVQTAKFLEQAGVDAIDVSGGRRPHSDHLTIAPMRLPSGNLVPFAEAVKKAVAVPVITVGKIDTALAMDIMDKGKADLIAMGRELIADPYLPLKAQEGRLPEIRNCIYCNYCVNERTRLRKRIRCAVNPSAGREKDFTIVKTRKRKDVLVVGAGPAGLECARVLALRGHDVNLKEKQSHPGGQARIGSIPNAKAAIRNIISYLEKELNRLGVKVDLNCNVTSEDIDKLKPDVIVLATGASPLIPEIKGIHNDRVKTGFDVLKSAGDGLGKKVVVIGGGDVGCEIAEYLAEKGKKVTLVEQLKEIGMSMEVFTKKVFFENISQYDLQILTGNKVIRIEENKMFLLNSEGRESSIEFDHAVLAVGTVSNNTLWKELSLHDKKIYQIGDCAKVNNISQAIYEGGKLGRLI